MAIERKQLSELSSRGRLLIASPYAEGSPYHRSLVLLLEHNEQGAAGILLDGGFRTAVDGLRDQLPRQTEGNQLAASLAAIPVRVAVWTAGQLDQEMSQGLWFSAVVDPGRLLSSELPDWTACVREVGRSVYRDALGIRSFPPNPSVN